MDPTEQCRICLECLLKQEMQIDVPQSVVLNLSARREIEINLFRIRPIEAKAHPV